MGLLLRESLKISDMVFKLMGVATREGLAIIKFFGPRCSKEKVFFRYVIVHKWVFIN